MTYRLFAALAGALALFAAPALAEEGMWTFDHFPTMRAQKEIGWTPNQAWLDHARLSSASIPGCSAAIVSGEGLIQTNHHCAVGCLESIIAPGKDFMRDGFIARKREDEQICPGMITQVLTEISDVTPRMAKAIEGAAPADFTKKLNGEIAAIERECKAGRADRGCSVATLYGGGQYKLYAYKRYTDTRLVFAPEHDQAAFGGDPDNFNFPRYDFDVSYFRLYENGKPALTPQHFTLRAAPLKAGEPVLISGNPGSTSRALTMSELAFQRDVVLPWRLQTGAEMRGRLIVFGQRGPDEMQMAEGTLQGTENSFKGRVGRRLALVDPAVWSAKQAQENELRKRIAADPKLAATAAEFDTIEKATNAYRGFFLLHNYVEAGAGGGSDLFGYARTLVRAAAERTKPDAERLPGFTEAALPAAQVRLLAPAKVDKPMDRLVLEFWLMKTREYLTADDPFVRKVLGKESPEALAARLVAGTKLADPAERKRLWEGGATAIAASTDPMIVFVRSWDDDARAVRKRYEQTVSGPIALAHVRIARAKFALYGDADYPDATGTLRLSYGRVQGWTQPSGAVVAPFTNVAGLIARATEAPPYRLVPSWQKSVGTLNKATIFNVSTTNDIIGGNSGSPLIDTQGRVVGAVFDGNIHSLGGDYYYDPRLNRSVAVASTIILEGLTKVYGAKELVAEMTR